MKHKLRQYVLLLFLPCVVMSMAMLYTKLPETKNREFTEIQELVQVYNKRTPRDGLKDFLADMRYAIAKLRSICLNCCNCCRKQRAAPSDSSNHEVELTCKHFSQLEAAPRNPEPISEEITHPDRQFSDSDQNESSRYLERYCFNFVDEDEGEVRGTAASQEI